MNMLGSHWRWRVVLTAILCALIITTLWQLRQKVDRRILAGGGGTPILIVAFGRYSTSIEAWDAASGTHWILFERRWGDFYEGAPTFTAVRNGQAVAFVENQILHVVEAMPPHQETTCEIPVMPRRGPIRMIGLSPDEKYGVFEDGFPAYRFMGIPGPPMIVVLELKRQRIVSQEIASYAQIRGTSGEFIIGGGQPRRQLDDQGEWVELPLSEEESLLASGKAFGRQTRESTLEIVDEDEAKLTNKRPSPAQLVQFSPTSNRYLARYLNSYYIGDLDSPNPRELKRLETNVKATEPVRSLAFQASGKAISFMDAWGDLFQLDLDDGQITTIAKSGTHQYRTTMLLAISLGGLALAYTLIALREQSLAWGLLDAAHVAWLALTVAILTRIAHFPFDAYPFSLAQWRVAMWANPIYTGIFVAGFYGVAWYWVFGQGPLLSRITWGTIGLFVVIAPVVVTERLYSVDRIPLWGWWDRALAWAIAATTLLASILSIARWLGWRFRQKADSPAPVSTHMGRFGLASIFCIITLAALAMTLRRVEWMGSGFINVHEAVFQAAVFSPGLGLALPMLLTLERRRDALWGVAIVACVIVLELTVLAVITQGAGLNLFSQIVTRCSAALFAAVLPCLLLRRHGYRWSRASSAVEIPA